MYDRLWSGSPLPASSIQFAVVKTQPTDEYGVRRSAAAAPSGSPCSASIPLWQTVGNPGSNGSGTSGGNAFIQTRISCPEPTSK